MAAAMKSPPGGNTAGETPERLSLGQALPLSAHYNPTTSFQSMHGGGQSAGGAAAANAPSSSLVNPTSLALSLPHSDYSVPIAQVDIQSLHYLMNEMPHILRNGARRSTARRKKIADQLRKVGGDSAAVDALKQTTTTDDDVVARLESIGSHVGATYAERLSRDRANFATMLDVLKFICKELWTAIWEKQVDNLRTNHRGVYVLQDNVFKPLLRLSVPTDDTTSADATQRRLIRIQLALPIGIIRGALSRLGIASTVVAESSQVPQCTFHVKTQGGAVKS